VKIEANVFLVMMSYIDVVGYQCFIGPCCLHLQGEVVNGFIIVRIVKFEVMNE